MNLDFEAAAAAFQENFRSSVELGASLSVWRNGRPALSLAGGYRDQQKTGAWTESTPVLVWSATKGPAAACVLKALEDRGIALATPVRELWPEFAQAGKESVKFSHILSHQCGLPALDEAVDVLDYNAVTAALERQAPLWPPGEAHGYHPRTFGFLLDEIVRRATGGIPLSEFWRQTFAEPMGLEFWIGVPEELLPRVAPVFPARAGRKPMDADFYAAYFDPESLTARAFSSPSGLEGIASMNTDDARRRSFPAFGGIGTAGALARFYAMLAGGGVWKGRSYFSGETLQQMEMPLVQGRDRILCMQTAFSAGFMKDPFERGIMGRSPTAFGHPGAGGSLAFADPENGLGFAYVMNQMGADVLPNARVTAILKALYGGS